MNSEEQKVPQSTSSEIPENQPQQVKKNKKFLLFLAIVIVLGLLLGGAAVWAYEYFSDETPAEESMDEETEDAEDDSEEDADIPEDEEITEDPGTSTENEQEVETMSVLCNGYTGTPVDKYSMTFEYPEEVSVTEDPTPVIPGRDCNFTFEYMGAEMTLQFDVGEAFIGNLDAGYTELMDLPVSPVLAADYSSLILVRTATTLDSGSYSYSYSTMVEDSHCTPSPLNETLEPPCAFGAHFGIPGASYLSASIPSSLSATERAEVTEIFDDIATSFEGETLIETE